MLLQICDYLRKAKIASNQQLAREFNLDLTALQPMLEVWINRGIITPCNGVASCKNRCFKCGSGEPLVYYQYVNDAP